jgi:hypothetical protein
MINLLGAASRKTKETCSDTFKVPSHDSLEGNTKKKKSENSIGPEGCIEIQVSGSGFNSCGSPCGGGLEYFHRNPCES